MVKPVKLHLIVSANPKAYASDGGMAAGELAGTPETFAYFLNPKKFGGIEPGVFYSANLGNKGLAWYLPGDETIRKELLRRFGTSVQINGQLIVVDSVGYFYEPQKKGIHWQFEADGLMTLREIQEKSDLQRYLIEAHKEVVIKRDPGWSKSNLEWILIREMKRIKNPIETKNNRLNPFIIKTQDGEEHILRASSIQPNVYATLKKNQRLPKVDNKTSPKNMENEMLTEILSSKGKRFCEATVHEIFKQRLTQKERYIINEGRTSKGRFDIAYKDENDILVAIEFKVGTADNRTLKQLKDYMGGIEWKGRKIGKIIARSCKPSTEKRISKLSNIQFVPYNLSLSFPGLFTLSPNENVSK